MVPAERHRYILERLESENAVSTGALLEHLPVTAMTLWRDLRLLEDQGMLKRVRGGAMHAGARREPRFDDKLGQARRAKATVAAEAARRFVRPGETLFLEGGTTVAALAATLDAPDLTVLTNSLPVLQTLRTLGCRPAIHGSGGLLREESGTFVGRHAETFFTRRSARTFFMSAAGLASDVGPMDPNPQEIEVKRAMARASERTILLADGSKWAEAALQVVLPWSKIEAVVTEREARPSVPAALAERCVCAPDARR